MLRKGYYQKENKYYSNEIKIIGIYEQLFSQKLHIFGQIHITTRVNYFMLYIWIYAGVTPSV